MQAATIYSTAVISELTGTLAANTQVTANGRAQTAVVERTSSAYEAYVPDQPGPVATGSSLNRADLRLGSHVQFQAQGQSGGLSDLSSERSCRNRRLPT